MSYLDSGLALLAGVVNFQRSYREVSIGVGFAARRWSLCRCNALLHALSKARGCKKKRSDDSRGAHLEVCIAKKGMRLRDTRNCTARRMMLNGRKDAG